MFYGVYGRNGAGVYYHWDKVLKSQPFINGMQVKKFLTLKEAMEFVRHGLVETYGVIPDGKLNNGLLYSRQNFFFHLPELMIQA